MTLSRSLRWPEARGNILIPFVLLLIAGAVIGFWSRTGASAGTLRLMPGYHQVDIRLSTDTLALVGLDYDPYAAGRGSEAVPAILAKQLPYDLPEVGDIDQLKSTFLQVVLPIALVLREERKFQRALVEIWSENPVRNPAIESLINDLYAYYDIPENDHQALKQALVPIPVSLVLAQAALESGWGRSRFAQVGNALFGQISADHTGIAASRNPGYRVRKFATLTRSMRAYLRNISTHRVYHTLRVAAAKGVPADKLSGYLTAYAQTGKHYGRQLARLIRQNDLLLFDQARLEQP